MRIAHPRRGYSGTEIHQARELKFVDGVAETDDSVALAAALSVKGYRTAEDSVTFADGGVVPKRKRAKRDISVEDDVEFTPEHEPTIDD